LAVHKNLQLLYQIRKAVLERDNYTCQKCGLVKASTYNDKYRDHLVRERRRGFHLDVYDWDHNEPLTTVWQVTFHWTGSVPERYITWCRQCSDLENIEQYRELKFECPIHRGDNKKHYDSGDCWAKSYDTEIAIWLNGRDLGALKELAHNEDTTCRDLVTEAIHDLFDKHGLAFADSCEHCKKED
jgi:hypothetical protein